MPGLLRIIQLVRSAPGERDLQLIDEDRVDKPLGLLGQDAHGFGIVDPVAGLDDVLLEELGKIVLSERDDAALGVEGVGFLGPGRLGDDRHAEPRLGRFERRARARDPAADDENVELQARVAHHDLRPNSRLMSTDAMEWVRAPTEM